MKSKCSLCWDSLDSCTCTPEQISRYEQSTKDFQQGYRRGKMIALTEAQNLTNLSNDITHEQKIILWNELESLKKK